MNKTGKTLVKVDRSPDILFKRVVAILEQARANVVCSVNSNMTAAYWLIGQEIVQELQRGENRAEYGKRVIGDLSDRLTKRYGGAILLPASNIFALFTSPIRIVLRK